MQQVNNNFDDCYYLTEEGIIYNSKTKAYIKPNKQHNNGNQLLNDMEKIIENSDDVITAGLLCMIL